MRPLDDDFGSVLSEYSKQGWTTRDIIWPELADNQVRTIGGTRRVGGSSSLVIPLDTGSVQHASTPDSVIEYAQFKILAEHSPYFNMGLQNQILRIQVQQLKSPALRHGYTASEPWCTYITQRLQRWAWVELYKLEPVERPQQFANGIPDHSHVSLPEEFGMPETWDYADDQMPLWYLEWEQVPEKHEFGFR